MMREAATKQLLTLVLLTVLFWYTAVSPAPAFVRGARAADPRDAEERDADSAAGGRHVVGAGKLEGPAGTVEEAIDDLDWPDTLDI